MTSDGVCLLTEGLRSDVCLAVGGASYFEDGGGENVFLSTMVRIFDDVNNKRNN